MIERRNTVVAVVTALGSSLGVLLSLLVLPGTANAALPATNSTYKDSLAYQSYTASLKLRVGGNKNKLAKVTVIVDCGPKTDKWVVRNVEILSSGAFRVHLGRDGTLRGTFVSKSKAEGTLVTNLHCQFGGEFKATKG